MVSSKHLQDMFSENVHETNLKSSRLLNYVKLDMAVFSNYNYSENKSSPLLLALKHHQYDI